MSISAYGFREIGRACPRISLLSRRNRLALWYSALEPYKNSPGESREIPSAVAAGDDEARRSRILSPFRPSAEIIQVRVKVAEAPTALFRCYCAIDFCCLFRRPLRTLRFHPSESFTITVRRWLEGRALLNNGPAVSRALFHHVLLISISVTHRVNDGGRPFAVYRTWDWTIWRQSTAIHGPRPIARILNFWDGRNSRQ